MKRVRNFKQAVSIHAERGVAAVEMALVLPFLVLLVLMSVDLGLVLREHQIAQNAAREGARFSALPLNQVGPVNPPASIAAIEQRVTDYLASENITVPAGSITVNQQFPIRIGSYTVYGSEVTISYTRPLLVPAVGLIPAGNVTLTGRSVFRNLY
jgi:hypothetical protein